MKILLITIFSVLAFPVSANFYSNILSEDDYQLQIKESFEPIMTSATNDIVQWESYNQWSCFPAYTVNYECVVYDDSVKIPNLHVTSNNHTYQFDVSIPDKEYISECNDVLVEWKNLIKDSKEICMFAAYMPAVQEEDYPSNWSLWYVVKIKTENGYWKIQNGLSN